jgi:phosphoserine phosphatase
MRTGHCRPPGIPKSQDSHHDLAGSYFYSDSQNDLPLLELVEHPVAVDPDDSLRSLAMARNWPVMSLRD